MPEEQTIIFGIPVPSSDPLFITIVVIHILLGIICVISGFIAMMSRKGRGNHSRWGKLYYATLLLIFVTIIPLSVMRWPANNHLLALGILSFGAASYGRWIVRHHKHAWPRLHTICMGCSYIFLLTAFYVDNGKHLPFWRQFPQLFFWIFPAAIGVPIILYSLLRHPLNRIIRNKEV
ncbi:MAG: hypothetical protein JST46_10665 [Bacteroidetes bacterium]|nr:hypothetical protein [Bacteroidota bacterium]